MLLNKSSVLKGLLEEDEVTFRPTCAIPFHAQMIEATGFKAVGLSGSQTAGFLLGLPDAALITQTEMVDNIRNTARSVDIPVMADVDQGYGGPLQVRRTVSEVIRAGGAGVFIEDQGGVKRCTYAAGKTVTPIEDALSKYEAAIDGKMALDPDFIIMARCDSRTAIGGGMEETVKRTKAYLELGVDAVYVAGMQSLDECRYVRENVKGLLAFGIRAIDPYPTIDDLQSVGAAITMEINYHKVGNVAMWDFLQRLKNEGTKPWGDFLKSHDDHPVGGIRTQDLWGFQDVPKWEAKYFKNDTEKQYEGDEEFTYAYDPTAEPLIKGRRAML